jgi:DNA-binding PadR family transcriptional regulator
MLRFAILELLHRKPLSGYDLKKRFAGSVGFFWKAKHSQIYPELRRLESEGLVTASRVPHQWRPTKKLYRITAKGLEELVHWLRVRPELQAGKDGMMLKCFAFHLLEPAQAADQIAHHRALHQKRLDAHREAKLQVEARHGSPESTGDPILFWNAVTLHYAIAFEKTYVAWCDWALEQQRGFLERAASSDGVARTGPGVAGSEHQNEELALP